ncbi:transient receptor potential cation channel protein painless-like [Chironomus tepperi]|uniref:transient receptor potential cation channel protein painless-like n=1 Tax=Chironomus tepperi TaxID=113505 RepID=UPI00391F778F
MIKSQKENLTRLVKAFERRNEQEFKFILDTYAIRTDISLECIGIDMSTIEYILQTPNSRNFIQICLYYGLDFYKKNSKGQYLVYYAFKSMCAENLETLINYSNCLPLTDPSKSLAYQLILNNEIGSKNNNFLHEVIENLTTSNYHESLKMVELLLTCGCNPNHLNDESKSPLDILLEKSDDSSITEIVNMFLKFKNIEISDNESNKQAIITLDISDKVILRKHTTNNISELFEHIYNRNEAQFIEGIRNINQTLILSNFRELLKLTIQCNFTKGTIYLLKYAKGSDNQLTIMELLKDKSDGISLFFYALCLCRCDVIEEFLKIDSIKFDSDDKCWNVLHEICSLTKHVESDEDFQKCFDLIINDKRCTKDIINAFDNNNKTPLMHACENGHEKIALELLRRGAYIGHKSVLHNLSEETLKNFLDECIVPTTDLNDKDCSVQINFKFLISPDIYEKETRALDLISSLDKFKNLVIHPVFTSFLELKWKRLNFLIYIGIFLHFIFLIYMSIFILNFFDSPIYNTINSSGMEVNDGDSQLTDLDLHPPLDIPYNEDDPLPNMPEYHGSGYGDSDQGAGGSNSGVKYSSNGFVFPTEPSGRNPIYRGFETSNSDENVESRGTFPSPSPSTTTTPRTHFVPFNNNEDPSRKPVNVLKVLFFGKNSRRRKRDVSEDITEEDHIKAHAMTYLICLFGTFLLTIYEISQFILSRRHYFLKLSNWVDCFLLGLSYYVLTTEQRYESDFRYLRALFFLVLAVQCFILIARVSKLSLQLEIFKKVCKTFLKFLLVYSMLIFAFAMAFYTIYNNRHSEQKKEDDKSTASSEEDEDKSFDNIFISIITVIRMMLADFESIKLNPDSHLDIIIFLSFVLLISKLSMSRRESQW